MSNMMLLWSAILVGILHIGPVVCNRGSLGGFGETERELTFEIGAGKEECFYESVEKGNVIDIEYQVIDGGQANDLRIDFRLLRPDGVPVIADYGKSDTAHRNTADMAGDYKLCFDNTQSRFGSKIVFFGVIVEQDDDDDGDRDVGRVGSDEIYGDASRGYDVKVEDIEDSLQVIRDRISRSRHLQDQLRAFEFRDRSVAEHNFERINFWSIVQISVMLFAGVIQLVLIRSIFDEKSAIHKFWKNR